jgi:hypothetical protein
MKSDRECTGNSGGKRLRVGDSRPRICVKELAFLQLQIVSEEDALFSDLLFVANR